MITMERSINNYDIRISERTFDIRNWKNSCVQSKVFTLSHFNLIWIHSRCIITDNRKTMKILNWRLCSFSAALECARKSWSKYLCTCCKLEYAINRLQLQRTPMPVVKDNCHNKNREDALQLFFNSSFSVDSLSIE